MLNGADSRKLDANSEKEALTLSSTYTVDTGPNADGVPITLAPALLVSVRLEYSVPGGQPVVRADAEHAFSAIKPVRPDPNCASMPPISALVDVTVYNRLTASGKLE